MLTLIPGTLFRIGVVLWWFSVIWHSQRCALECYSFPPPVWSGYNRCMVQTGVYGGGHASILPPSIHPVRFCLALRPLSEKKTKKCWGVGSIVSRCQDTRAESFGRCVREESALSTFNELCLLLHPVGLTLFHVTARPSCLWVFNSMMIISRVYFSGE